MTFSCERDQALQDFSGFAPLFPLPNVVLFPQSLLPLQIFEHRYRMMTADALDGERLIAMSLLQTGWEKLPSNANPPIHHIVGLGKIIAHEKLDDGRYYLVLRGLARARLLNEQNGDLPYRVGHLEICHELHDESTQFNSADRIEELISLFVQIFPAVNLKQLFLQAVTELPLEVVCDVLLGAMPLSPELAQQFLNELNIEARSQLLLDLLKQFTRRAAPTSKRNFPPMFSKN